MFPIVHYYTNQIIYGKVPPLMALGGLFPDLASGCGLNRDEAHEMGDAFFRYCAKQIPEALPLARGILSHGVKPHGVDYYADEHWPGCEKGWCFEQGKPWMERIAQVTRLPDNLIWWKSHNFVEISCELITIAAHPQIGRQIMAACEDQALVAFAGEVLHRYTGNDQEKLTNMFRQAPEIFALAEVTPLEQAIRQEEAFRRRHNVYQADITGIAALFEEMSAALADDYDTYMPESIGLVATMLCHYD